MKSLISNRSKGKVILNNILEIGEMAKRARLSDDTVVDATIGVLFDEDEKLFTYNSVGKMINTLDPKTYLSYTTTVGGEKYKQAICKWVLNQHLNYYQENFHIGVMATPGGSGAISISMANYADRGEKILVPNIGWGIYYTMCHEADLEDVRYNLVKDGKFDLKDLKVKIESIFQTQDKLLLVINDPCHNPTGYTMTNDEWEQIVSFVNEYKTKNKDLIILLDAAYIDYNKEGKNSSRVMFDVLKTINEDSLILVACSASKTFTLYGVRIGALIAISNNDKHIEQFMEVIEYSSRSRWSLSSHFGIKLVEEMMFNDNANQSYNIELKNAVDLLKSRGEIFVSEANACNLEILPYHSGFFIVIPNCPKSVYEKFVEKGIYTIPIGNECLRLAISAIPLSKIKGLAKRIKMIQKQNS